MAIVNFEHNPKITDTIILEIETPDADGCFIVDPFKVDNVIIYFVERNFLGHNWGEHTDYHTNDNLVQAVINAKQAVCDDPSPENVQKYELALSELESAKVKSTFHYKDRKPVEVIGTATFPAWLSTDIDNSPFTKVDEDEDGNPVFGRFAFEWMPNGAIREGDYFICWTWTPLPAGDKLSAHKHFKIMGDPKAVTAIPIHRTADGKYEELLERYLSEMYKTTLSDNDITPETLLKFNNAVASGFTFIEDFANQVIDLFDANVLHEALLTYLSNGFNLKLKSSDPTLWRRQIKEAIPLFKQKGTLKGLQKAFSQAGMLLNSYTQYWQIVSPYTWQESFLVKDTAIFELEKDSIVLPIDDDNFELWLRREGEDDYVAYSKDYVSFEIGDDFILRMTWIGDQLSASPVEIFEGDIIRVLYEYNEVPNPSEQTLEDYIRALPLADQRDEADQEFPPKNWNVRLIEEGDPLFDILIPVKQPFYDPLIFGYIRTEFAYSENIYNMDEYNGSTRPSLNVCHIDKSFRDPCGACLSSKYSVDVGIEELSNDRILEAQDILREYMPFHAQLHSIGISGEINEFVQSPVENIQFLLTFWHMENVLSGQANPFFHRVMEGGLSNWIIDRGDLAEQNTVFSGSGTAYNEYIAVVATDIEFDDLGVSPNHIFEVLAPSANAGTYEIGNISKSTANVITPVSEPLDETQFTFRLSNITYSSSTTNITQDDLFQFSDDSVNFADLGVKTLWDVDHTPDYTGGSWKVSIPAYSGTPYDIEDIINGNLILVDTGTLPTIAVSGISYTLQNDVSDTIATSTTGSLSVDRRALIDLNDIAITDIHVVADFGYLLFYSGTEYEIVRFDESSATFWIDDYSGGDVAGATIEIRKRLANNKIGQFGYRGLRIVTAIDHEAALDVMDGANPPLVITDDNKFKANFMFSIDSDFFKVLEWDGTDVKLAGRLQNWGVATGTSVSYDIVQFEKTMINVQFLVFDHLDRDGHDVIVREVLDTISDTTTVAALSMNPGSGFQENIMQEESISFVIEKKDGTKTTGKL